MLELPQAQASAGMTADGETYKQNQENREPRKKYKRENYENNEINTSNNRCIGGLREHAVARAER
jgi:hypothetical protein